MNDKNWTQKDKRELFCKTINCLLMRLPEGKGADMKYIIDVAKEAVNKAFELYPNEEEEKETNFSFGEQTSDKRKNKYQANLNKSDVGETEV